MATKKEVAKEKAIKGGMPLDVADNIFKMQMGAKETDTPSTFSTKNQKVMAMSTMYQTKDPNGTRQKVEPVTYNLQIAGSEPITSKQVFTGYSGGGVFQNQEQKDFYDNQIAQRIATGMTPEQAVQDYRNTFKIGEKQFKTELSGGETKYTIKPNKSSFDQGFDSTFTPNLPEVNLEKFTYKKKGDAGMVDTFSSYDTRQAARKAIVEGRKAKQAARREARAEMKAGNITRKQFRQKKKEANLAQARARAEAMKKIAAQGQAQRAAGKNPATTKEFDPNQAVFPMKVMQFRKKYKK